MGYLMLKFYSLQMFNYNNNLYFQPPFAIIFQYHFFVYNIHLFAYRYMVSSIPIQY